MKLYAISGLGADERVFNYLTLEHELIPIPWLKPNKNESIEIYAKRMAQCIDTNEEFGILGVSFGGMIAVEMSKLINPKLTILISSSETNIGLRRIYRWYGKTNITRILPSMFFQLPTKVVAWLFGTKEVDLLKDILSDADNSSTKWAIYQIVNWKSRGRIKNCIKIKGTKDKLIPAIKSENEILVEGGEHFMIVDKADEISMIINKSIVLGS